jgi:ABC-type sulfate transport system permease component
MQLTTMATFLSLARVPIVILVDKAFGVLFAWAAVSSPFPISFTADRNQELQPLVVELPRSMSTKAVRTFTSVVITTWTRPMASRMRLRSWMEFAVLWFIGES